MAKSFFKILFFLLILANPMDLVYILSLSLYFTHTKLVGDGARFSSLLPNSKQISHTSEREKKNKSIWCRKWKCSKGSSTHWRTVWVYTSWVAIKIVLFWFQGYFYVYIVVIVRFHTYYFFHLFHLVMYKFKMNYWLFSSFLLKLFNDFFDIN